MHYWAARKIRMNQKYPEAVSSGEALARTIARERANPPGEPTGIGLADDEAEDVIVRELRDRSRTD